MVANIRGIAGVTGRATTGLEDQNSKGIRCRLYQNQIPTTLIEH